VKKPLSQICGWWSARDGAGLWLEKPPMFYFFHRDMTVEASVQNPESLSHAASSQQSLDPPVAQKGYVAK